jgi:hypothetical protein
MSEDFKATVQKYGKWESLITMPLLSQYSNYSWRMMMMLVNRMIAWKVQSLAFAEILEVMAMTSQLGGGREFHARAAGTSEKERSPIVGWKVRDMMTLIWDVAETPHPQHGKHKYSFKDGVLENCCIRKIDRRQCRSSKHVRNCSQSKLSLTGSLWLSPSRCTSGKMAKTDDFWSMNNANINRLFSVTRTQQL